MDEARSHYMQVLAAVTELDRLVKEDAINWQAAAQRTAARHSQLVAATGEAQSTAATAGDSPSVVRQLDTRAGELESQVSSLMEETRALQRLLDAHAPLAAAIANALKLIVRGMQNERPPHRMAAAVRRVLHQPCLHFAQHLAPERAQQYHMALAPFELPAQHEESM